MGMQKKSFSAFNEFGGSCQIVCLSAVTYATQSVLILISFSLVRVSISLTLFGRVYAICNTVLQYCADRHTQGLTVWTYIDFACVHLSYVLCVSVYSQLIIIDHYR